MGHCELPVLQWASKTSLESLCVSFCEGANGVARVQMRAGPGRADGAPVAHDCSSGAPGVTRLFLLQAPKTIFLYLAMLLKVEKGKRRYKARSWDLRERSRAGMGKLRSACQMWLATFFSFLESCTGTQPDLLVYVLSIAAFVIQ